MSKIDSSQASRIYLLPNLFTAGNLFCGFMAIMKCIQARYNVMLDDPFENPARLYTEAVLFILGGMLCDSLDGRVARLGGRESLFGKEFDSIVDMVSFGVAPALMVMFLIFESRGEPLFSKYRVVSRLCLSPVRRRSAARSFQRNHSSLSIQQILTGRTAILSACPCPPLPG